MQTDAMERPRAGLSAAKPGVCSRGWMACALGAMAFLTGCGASLTSTATPVTVGAGLHGKLMGGNQPDRVGVDPVVCSGDDGLWLGGGADSQAGGNFQTRAENFVLTGEFTCPSSDTQVYMVVSGGNPGLAPGTNNPAIGLMALLGPCGGLQPTSFIVVNELTTVAAVWTMAPFMLDAAHIGTSPTNVQGLLNAVATGLSLVNTASGATPGNAPAIATVPMAEISTLGNILSTCINSNGNTSDGTACGRLFSAVTRAAA